VTGILEKTAGRFLRASCFVQSAEGRSDIDTWGKGKCKGPEVGWGFEITQYRGRCIINIL
jgi:hypothetical protein